MASAILLLIYVSWFNFKNALRGLDKRDIEIDVLCFCRTVLKTLDICLTAVIDLWVETHLKYLKYLSFTQKQMKL